MLRVFGKNWPQWIAIPWAAAGWLMSAFSGQLPGWVQWVGLYAAIALTAYSVIAIIFFHFSALEGALFSLFPRKWPDFEKWDQRDVFQLYEAACLWFDHEPSLPMSRKARTKFRQWKDMREVLPVEGSKTIREAVDRAYTLVEGGNPITVHTKISREVLKGLAEEDGRRPLFLYREYRDR